MAMLLLAAAPTPAISPAPVTDKPCFGAASRDPVKRCFDASLRTTIFPPPAEAPLEANAPCVPAGRTRLLYPCTFGVRTVASGDGSASASASASGTIALIGDSHASAWRAAVEVVAEHKSLPAVSMARSRCPFIDATVVLPRADGIRCRGWNREVKAYLASHPKISTVFISDRSSARFVLAKGKNSLETQVAGHLALWRSLPATITNIIIIRDTPRGSAASSLCVQRAFAARRASPGQLCARSRAQALHIDPAVVAARRLNSPRVHAVDLSSVFCDARRCFPVIGGAAVYKDVDHISAVFARTLGPLLLRAYDDIVGTPGADDSAPPSAPGPLDILIADERAAAECLLSERLAASQVGGFQNVAPENRDRANGCRAMLEQRAAQIKAAGLTGERNRKHRYELIVAVLKT